MYFVMSKYTVISLAFGRDEVDGVVLAAGTPSLAVFAMISTAFSREPTGNPQGQ
jgi:hypothetical protein